MLQGLHQEEAQQRHPEGEEEDAAGSQLPGLAGPVSRTVFVLGDGPRTNLAGQEAQQRDQDRNQDGERHRVKEDLLDVQGMVGRGIDLEPRVKIARPSEDDDRQGQDEHPREKKAGDGFGDPADGSGPTGIKQMVSQGEEQRTHAEAQAEHVRREVAVGDLFEGEDRDGSMTVIVGPVTGRSVRSVLSRVGSGPSIGAHSGQSAEQGK